MSFNFTRRNRLQYVLLCMCGNYGSMKQRQPTKLHDTTIPPYMNDRQYHNLIDAVLPCIITWLPTTLIDVYCCPCCCVSLHYLPRLWAVFVVDAPSTLVWLIATVARTIHTSAIDPLRRRLPCICSQLHVLLCSLLIHFFRKGWFVAYDAHWFRLMQISYPTQKSIARIN